jgi:hypothetical protein
MSSIYFNCCLVYYRHDKQQFIHDAPGIVRRSGRTIVGADQTDGDLPLPHRSPGVLLGAHVMRGPYRRGQGSSSPMRSSPVGLVLATAMAPRPWDDARSRAMAMAAPAAKPPMNTVWRPPRRGVIPVQRPCTSPHPNSATRVTPPTPRAPPRGGSPAYPGSAGSALPQCMRGQWSGYCARRGWSRGRRARVQRAS